MVRSRPLHAIDVCVDLPNVRMKYEHKTLMIDVSPRYGYI